MTSFCFKIWLKSDFYYKEKAKKGLYNCLEKETDPRLVPSR